MKIKGEDFIPLHDVINVHYSVVDEMCFDELGRRVGKVAIHIDEERLKKWVHQAKFIENISAENITDIAAREMIYNLQRENKMLEKALELAIKELQIPDGHCADNVCPEIRCRACLLDYFKTKAKEKM